MDTSGSRKGQYLLDHICLLSKSQTGYRIKNKIKQDIVFLLPRSDVWFCLEGEKAFCRCHFFPLSASFRFLPHSSALVDAFGFCFPLLNLFTHSVSVFRFRICPPPFRFPHSNFLRIQFPLSALSFRFPLSLPLLLPTLSPSCFRFRIGSRHPSTFHFPIPLSAFAFRFPLSLPLPHWFPSRKLVTALGTRWIKR